MCHIVSKVSVSVPILLSFLFCDDYPDQEQIWGDEGLFGL